jgi:hypothetical protein
MRGIQARFQSVLSRGAASSQLSRTLQMKGADIFSNNYSQSSNVRFKRDSPSSTSVRLEDATVINEAA